MFTIAVILCFKVADQNGANVFTDIYISGSQFSVNAWPNVTIVPDGDEHISPTQEWLRMCCPTAGFGSRRGFSHLRY